MVATSVQALMGAEADALCGALYGERSPERVNRRNGYRGPGLQHPGRHDVVSIPKLREGELLPGLVAHAPQAGRAAVVAECGVKAVSPGESMA
jgi:transposase-like protein